MLREMTWEQFQEWETFEELEPFDSERADYRSAHIVQTLWNIARNQDKHPNGWPITDFLLSFGDTPRMKVAQSLETQTLLIESWVTGHNEAVGKK